MRSGRLIGLILLLIGVATSEVRAQSCDFLMPDLEFGHLYPTDAGGALALGTMTARCSGTPGQRIRACPRFWLGSEPTAIRADNGSQIPFWFTQASGDSIGQTFDGLGLDVVIGPTGTGTGSIVIGARLDPSAVRAYAGRHSARIGGDAARVTYGDAALGRCSQQTHNVFGVASFSIGATIQPICTVSPGRLDFGTIISLDRPADAQTWVEIQCTAGTRYEIALEGGRGGGKDPARRLLASGPDILNYAIYSDARRILPWGNGTTGATVTGTGTGNREMLKIFGRIHAQPAAVAGNYSDELIISVRH